VYSEIDICAVFLDTSANNVSLDITTSFPYALSWKKAEGISDYSIAISTQVLSPISTV
jgi:hypothetical protein